MNIDRETQQWAMLLHFSVLAVWIIPVLGLIIPSIIWQIKRQELPKIDIHGKIVMNWMVSQLIYIPLFVVISIIIVFFFPKFSFVFPPFFLFIIILTNTFFPILSGIKAGNGEIWRYPFSIRFLK